MSRRPTHARLTMLVALTGLFVSASARAGGAAPGSAPLRAAIKDLARTFPKRYSKGADFLERLDAVEKTADPKAASAALAKLRREALIANPLVSAQPILFVVRGQYRPDHHNTATMFQTGEINTRGFRGGGALKKIELPAGKVTVLVANPKGVCRDPEVSFDGKRIVFSMRKDVGDDYKLYQINADGSALRQLTFAKGVADIDPLYLPDGSIAFTSTREPKYCMCNRHIMGNLFRMDADGANIHQIGKSTLHEGHGSLMPDGRILYDRWEYVDRNFGDAQGLWTVNPDGTNHAIYWGQHTNSPGAVLDARIIPGTQRAVCIFGSCHDRPWGALAIIDRRLGMDGPKPVIRTWPASAVNRVGRGGWDAFSRVRPKYEDPYPLTDPSAPSAAGKYFLCSRTTGRGEQTGIYLVDVFGNEILLHTEAPGCYDPMPLGPRPKPHAIPSRRNFKNGDGSFYVQDVYLGTHMEGVKRGSVRSLRVVESPEKRFWTRGAWGGQGQHAPGMNWHSFENKRVLGTAPVEKDGSACFSVPADRFVYFQLLDEDGMMIQSMRSGTMVQPGETTGCIGCHENRLSSPPVGQNVPLALRRPASKLEGWYGRPRLFNYLAEVQPVFDKHCGRCHDFGKEAGAKLNMAGDKNLFFNASYTELWRKGMIRVAGAGPARVLKAYSWGSHASKLVDVVRKGHKKVKLSREEMDRIVTWIDINAVYYPSYASAYPRNLAGRSPLNGAQISRLSRLTGARFVNKWRGNTGPQVSFDRPELSPCLAGLKNKAEAKYKEALQIIRAGKEMLKKRPRADMPGFSPCEVDRRREAKYLARRKAEAHSRQAIREGSKAYDRPSGTAPVAGPGAPITTSDPAGAPKPEPQYLSPIAVVADKTGEALYVAEATSNQVAVVDIASGKVVKNLPAPGPPTGLALSDDGKRLYVTVGRAEGKVVVYDPAGGRQLAVIPVGHSPTSPVLAGDHKMLYVCNRFSNDVSTIDLRTSKELVRIPVLREPVAAVVAPDGKSLLVANHLPVGPADAGTVSAAVSVIATAEKKVAASILLPNGSTGLRGLCVSPDGRYACVTHALGRYNLPTTQLERGWMNTNALSVIDVSARKLINTVLLDDVDLGAANPWGVTWSEDGKWICVTHAGTHEISVIDANALMKKLDKAAADKQAHGVPNNLAFLVGLRRRIKLTGIGPRGLTVAGTKVYAAEYFTDSVGVVDIDPKVRPQPKSIALAAKKAMTPARKGEMLFNDARICFQNWQSCATCHPDGRADALNWDLTGDGIGNPKNTKSLLLSHKTPPSMITGMRDKAETAVRSGIRNILFAVRPEEDAAALDEYLKSLKPAASPHLVDGGLSDSAARGKKLFAAADCASCHPGPLYTDLKKYDAGTGSAEKNRKFDTTTLVEIWRTAPYLYDGRAANMIDVLKKHNERDLHGKTSKLTHKQLADLAEFILSL